MHLENNLKYMYIYTRQFERLALLRLHNFVPSKSLEPWGLSLCKHLYWPEPWAHVQWSRKKSRPWRDLRLDGCECMKLTCLLFNRQLGRVSPTTEHARSGLKVVFLLCLPLVCGNSAESILFPVRKSAESIASPAKKPYAEEKGGFVVLLANYNHFVTNNMGFPVSIPP